MWQVFSNVEETQIPQLQRFLHSNTLTRRYAAVRRAAEGLTAFCDSLEAYLSDSGGDEGGGAASTRAQSRLAYDRSSKELKGAVWGHMEALDQELGIQVLVPYLLLAGFSYPSFASPTVLLFVVCSSLNQDVCVSFSVSDSPIHCQSEKSLEQPQK